VHEAALHLFDRECGPATMQHGMAIRADGTQVADRVDTVVCPDSRELAQMVYVDETFADFPIALLEAEAAGCTTMSVKCKTR
jgi:hypothetical protein